MNVYKMLQNNRFKPGEMKEMARTLLIVDKVVNEREGKKKKGGGGKVFWWKLFTVGASGRCSRFITSPASFKDEEKVSFVQCYV